MPAENPSRGVGHILANMIWLYRALGQWGGCQEDGLQSRPHPCFHVGELVSHHIGIPEIEFMSARGLPYQLRRWLATAAAGVRTMRTNENFLQDHTAPFEFRRHFFMNPLYVRVRDQSAPNARLIADHKKFKPLRRELLERRFHAREKTKILSPLQIAGIKIERAVSVEKHRGMFHFPIAPIISSHEVVAVPNFPTTIPAA